MRKGNSLAFDTTPTLQGKATVMALFSSGWAEKQVNSFIAKEANPALHQVLKAHQGQAQIVRVNIEDQAILKYWIIRAMAPWIRKTLPEADWDKYFTLRTGITDEIRECIGFLNSKVGYVYLLDGDCRIRWAGSGQAESEEAESLAKGMTTLMSELRRGVWSGKSKQEDAAGR